MIKLSIGIPVYNQVDTIAEAIVSTLNQTIPPFEIVVCENHSTDGTKEVVESFGDKVRIVRPPEHLGMAANWNYCVSKCKGDWIGLCSGDDLLLPDYVRHMSDAINKHDSAGFVMGGWRRHFTETGLFQDHYLLSLKEKTSYPHSLKMLLSGPKASFAAFCFRKSLFDIIGGYDLNFFFIQDWMLQFDFAASNAEFICVKELIAQYRISERLEITEARKNKTLDDHLKYIENKIWLAESKEISKMNIAKAARKVYIYKILNFINDSNLKIEPVELNRLSLIAQKIDSMDVLEDFLKNGTILKYDKLGYFKNSIRFLYKFYKNLK